MRAIVTVIGQDRVGIIAAVCTELSACNVNILDINQTVMQEFFTMTMLVDTAAANAPFETLRDRLQARGEQIGLNIRIQREDIFNAMHKI